MPTFIKSIIDDTYDNSESSFSHTKKVARDSLGILYCLVSDMSDYRCYSYRSTDGGATWADKTLVADYATLDESIFVDAADLVHIFFTGDDDSLLRRKTYNNGWQPIVEIGISATNISSCVDAYGNIFLLWIGVDGQSLVIYPYFNGTGEVWYRTQTKAIGENVVAISCTGYADYIGCALCWTTTATDVIYFAVWTPGGEWNNTIPVPAPTGFMIYSPVVVSNETHQLTAFFQIGDGFNPLALGYASAYDTVATMATISAVTSVYAMAALDGFFYVFHSDDLGAINVSKWDDSFSPPEEVVAPQDPPNPFGVTVASCELGKIYTQIPTTGYCLFYQEYLSSPQKWRMISIMNADFLPRITRSSVVTNIGKSAIVEIIGGLCDEIQKEGFTGMMVGGSNRYLSPDNTELLDPYDMENATVTVVDGSTLNLSCTIETSNYGDGHISEAGVFNKNNGTMLSRMVLTKPVYYDGTRGDQITINYKIRIV